MTSDTSSNTSLELDYTIPLHFRHDSFESLRDSIINAGPAATDWPTFFAAYQDKSDQDRSKLISARRIAEQQLDSFTRTWVSKHKTAVTALKEDLAEAALEREELQSELAFSKGRVTVLKRQLRASKSQLVALECTVEEMRITRAAHRCCVPVFPVLSLPRELVVHVADKIDGFSTLNSLVRSCRQLYAILNRRMYQKAIAIMATYSGPVLLPPSPPPLSLIVPWTACNPPLGRVYGGFGSVLGRTLMSGNVAALEKFVRYGVAADARFVCWGWGGVDGATMLSISVMHAWEDMVRCLLEMGARGGKVDDGAVSAFWYLQKNKDEGFRRRIRYLLQKYA